MMQILRILALCATLVSTVLATGCNKPAGDASNTTSGNTAPPVRPVVASNEGAAAAAPAQPAAPPASDANTGRPSGEGAISGKVAEADLTGRWIALFGRDEKGSMLEAWNSGEVLEFRSNGELIWTQAAGAKPVSCGFDLSGMTLKIEQGGTAGVGRDEEVGVMGVGRDDAAGTMGVGRDDAAGTMGVGRDDSAGMMGVGRDDEVGMKGKAKSSEGSSSLSKRVFRDGDYLALIGTQNDIMIYGRVDNAAASEPEIKGHYTGRLFDKTDVLTEFSKKNGRLVGEFADSRGQFRGQWVNGFHVGYTNGANGNGAAAIRVQADGSLDGIALPMPFTTLNANFDFKPGR